jgi:hypothetical protein
METKLSIDSLNLNEIEYSVRLINNLTHTKNVYKIQHNTNHRASHFVFTI